jgi:hypothetical protein
MAQVKMLAQGGGEKGRYMFCYSSTTPPVETRQSMNLKELNNCLAIGMCNCDV